MTAVGWAKRGDQTCRALYLPASRQRQPPTPRCSAMPLTLARQGCFASQSPTPTIRPSPLLMVRSHSSLDLQSSIFVTAHPAGRFGQDEQDVQDSCSVVCKTIGTRVRISCQSCESCLNPRQAEQLPIFNLQSPILMPHLRRHGLLLGGLAGLALFVTWPLITRITTHVPGSDTWAYDEYTFIWSMWWFKYSLLDLHSSIFFSQNIFYPLGMELILYSYNLMAAILALPLGLATNWALASNITLALQHGPVGLRRVLAGVVDVEEQMSRRSEARSQRSEVRDQNGTRNTQHANRHHPPPSSPASSTPTPATALIYLALGHYNIQSWQYLPFFVLYILRIMERPDAAQHPPGGRVRRVQPAGGHAIRRVHGLPGRLPAADQTTAQGAVPAALRWPDAGWPCSALAFSPWSSPSPTSGRRSNPLPMPVSCSAAGATRSSSRPIWRAGSHPRPCIRCGAQIGCSACGRCRRASHPSAMSTPFSSATSPWRWPSSARS